MATTITISRRQKGWVDSNFITLSQLVRKLLDEEIARREGKLNGPEVPA